MRTANYKNCPAPYTPPNIQLAASCALCSHNHPPTHREQQWKHTSKAWSKLSIMAEQIASLIIRPAQHHQATELHLKLTECERTRYNKFSELSKLHVIFTNGRDGSFNITLISESGAGRGRGCALATYTCVPAYTRKFV